MCKPLLTSSVQLAPGTIPLSTELPYCTTYMQSHTSEPTPVMTTLIARVKPRSSRTAAPDSCWLWSSPAVVALCIAAPRLEPGAIPRFCRWVGKAEAYPAPLMVMVCTVVQGDSSNTRKDMAAGKCGNIA